MTWRTCLSIAVRALLLYLVTGVGLSLGVIPAAVFTQQISLGGVLTALLSLAMFVPLVVLCFLPLDRIRQMHIAIRSWVGFVASLLVLSSVLGAIA